MPLFDLLFTMGYAILSSVRVDVNGHDSSPVRTHLDFALESCKIKTNTAPWVMGKQTKDSCEHHQENASPLLGFQAVLPWFCVF